MAGSVDRCRTVALRFVRFFVAEFEEQGSTTCETQNDWCGPCKSFGRIFEKVSEDFPDAVFAKVDTQNEQEIAAMFQIRSIPTLMIFRENVIIFSQAGA